MHIHTVLVKLHDPETLDLCRSLMESMRGRIDTMIDLDVRVNELVGNYSYDIALTTTWPDADAYHAYETHPTHLEVRSVVLELMADAATIDYTVAGS